AAACKAVDAGSIPTLASNYLILQFLTTQDSCRNPAIHRHRRPGAQGFCIICMMSGMPGVRPFVVPPAAPEIFLRAPAFARIGQPEDHTTALAG
ncbi:MAG TPA: hypothetical protein PK403_15935, partial [Plasticicumulans sp.]|nr:hypothetical protein [Plasticicumulans sp.]